MNVRRWWDGVVPLVALGSSALALMVGPGHALMWWGLTVCSFLLIPVYAVGVRGALTTRLADPPPYGARAVPTRVLLPVIAVAAACFGPAALMLQLVVLPLVWTFSGTVRRALVVTVPTVLGMGAAALLGPWLISRFALDITPVGGDPVPVAGIQLAVLVLGTASGAWITHLGHRGAERNRLLEEVRESRRAEATAHREAGAAAERERIAREVHDTIAQHLTGIVVLAQRARGEETGAGETAGGGTDDDPGIPELIETTAREALEEARALIAANAAPPHGEGLADSLVRLGERFRRETGPPVAVTVTGPTDRLGRDREVLVLRCAQEAMANVRKHAAAHHVELTLRVGDGEAVLTVLDDGRGTPIDAPGAGGGFGLPGMRDRLLPIGGKLTVGPPDDGRPGTLLTVRLPVGEERGTPVVAVPAGAGRGGVA
ncbi:histidine kinase [Streptomyces sp. ST2-7A]|uniref:sensor histidine kinase n=1 Tax=Streptomyces sp. ST2-7A TaxID=2907214 RepID=UPI001F341F04|nr:histidine kinase [Streptomyces sp. ST2-7A]MCE7079086.1 histidine kinase [Streptomyces sp. ST2-7A]